MGDRKSIFISAGDRSADFPGKKLIEEIVELCPDIDIFGLGGPLMQASGLTPLADHDDLAVMGFWEVLPHLVFFRKLLDKAEREIKQKRPKAVILIDYPGFNLRLAARINHLGIPIGYYISPQVWAWGKRRLKDIQRLVDLMMVIFPFEEAFYREHGVAAHFIGHPVVDRYSGIPDKKVCRQEIGIEENKKVIALLPGSRLQEIRRMLPAMVESASIIGDKLPHSEFLVAGIDSIDKDVYADIIGKSSIRVVFGRTPELINGSDIVITSSGTATIETAFFMTPMVVIYKTGFFTYHIAKRLISLDCIGMVNIVAGKQIVPELIQRNASPDRIALHTLELMSNKELYDRMVADLKSVRDKLGPGNAGRRAAELIKETFSLC